MVLQQLMNVVSVLEITLHVLIVQTFQMDLLMKMNVVFVMLTLQMIVFRIV